MCDRVVLHNTRVGNMLGFGFPISSFFRLKEFLAFRALAVVSISKPYEVGRATLFVSRGVKKVLF